MKRILALLLLAAATACGGGEKSSGTGGITIAVIPKGTSHVFWQSIHSGAQKAATELGVSIIWRGPLREDDRDAQVSEVEGFISRGISGICLAPLDETALVPPVQEAARQSKPGGRERLTRLPFEEGICVVEDGIRGIHRVSRCRLMGER